MDQRSRQPRTESQVRFVSEQQGVSENALKERLVPLLRRNSSVQRAYLARVKYGSSPPEVALCLYSRDTDESLLLEIGAVFAGMFGQSQHLDMIFVNETQEMELLRVCRPFFRAFL